MEESQLHDKHQTVKQQLREQYLLQRQQLLARHEKEFQQIERQNYHQYEELDMRQKNEILRVPKVQAQEHKTRLIMFKQALKVQNIQGDAERNRLRDFKAQEEKRQKAELERQSYKHMQQKRELEENNISNLRELRQLQNEKKRLLVDRENERLNAMETSFRQDLHKWKQQILPRRQIIDQQFAQQLEQLERFVAAGKGRGPGQGQTDLIENPTNMRPIGLGNQLGNIQHMNNFIGNEFNQQQYGQGPETIADNMSHIMEEGIHEQNRHAHASKRQSQDIDNVSLDGVLDEDENGPRPAGIISRNKSLKQQPSMRSQRTHNTAQNQPSNQPPAPQNQPSNPNPPNHSQDMNDDQNFDSMSKHSHHSNSSHPSRSPNKSHRNMSIKSPRNSRHQVIPENEAMSNSNQHHQHDNSNLPDHVSQRSHMTHNSHHTQPHVNGNLEATPPNALSPNAERRNSMRNSSLQHSPSQKSMVRNGSKRMGSIRESTGMSRNGSVRNSMRSNKSYNQNQSHENVIIEDGEGSM